MSRFRRLRLLLPAAVAATIASLGLAGASAGSALDPTPPIITPVISGTLGDNGWHRSSVTVSWSVTDPESPIVEDDCRTRTQTQDTTGVSFSCWARNSAGLTGAYTIVIKVDTTPPAASAALDRAADFDGWYTEPVSAVFNGTDQTSGIASCTAPVTYEGPDTTGDEVPGTCRDKAGNQASAAVELRYDATAPVVSRIASARRPDRYGWFNRPVRFVLNGQDATSGIAGCESPSYAGPNDPRASVSGTCRDRAGNVSAPRAISFRYARPLLDPVRGARVSAPVRLRWVDAKRASYYNLQLWRGSRKILSVWPRGTSYRVARSWAYQGERYALKPGRRYRWYVWPKIGSRYGKLLGSSTFQVRRRATAGVEPLRLGPVG